MLNQHVKSMIEKGILFCGKISNVNGFTVFTRIPLEELEQTQESEIAFATGSMGRAVFQICDNGSIRNLKGVNSHLSDSEIITIQLANADASIALDPSGKNNDHENIIYPINLVRFVDESLDIRIRGASPLEDLEEEAEKNTKMQEIGIKLPKIANVREMPAEVCERFGLPIKIKGDYDDFGKVSYRWLNDGRKEFLHKTLGNTYYEDLPEGLRAESIEEYFFRTGLMESKEFIDFAEKYGLTVNDFVKSVDKSYKLGQRYGQTERIMESPFRISDLEYYVKNEDTEAANDIVTFSNELFNNEIPFETVFARQMGTNVALMMNSGWMYNNFMHRQDFSLAGEMCDDAYDNVKEHIKHLDLNTDEGKTIVDYEKKRYFLQLYTIASNIKILQDEMKLLGRSEEEQDKILDDFIQSFCDNIDFQKVGEVFGDSIEQVENLFTRLTTPEIDYARAMAEEFPKKDEPIGYNEQVLQGQQGFDVFYENFSEKLAKSLHIDRVKAEKSTILSDTIQATEETTRTGTINEQIEFIKEGIKKPQQDHHHTLE